MKLEIRLESRNYMRSSNIMIFFIDIAKNGSPDFASSMMESGYRTFLCHAMWKLFVHGKKVYGSPERFSVRLNRLEAFVFKMILQAHWDTNRGYWEQVCNDQVRKADALRYLSEELPRWVLKQKLEH